MRSSFSHLKLLQIGGILLAAASFAAAEAVSDVVVGYSATWRAGMGGTDQVNAAIYNQFGGANWIAGQSGSPHRMNVVATKESAHDPTNEVDCGAMIGWMWNYDGRITDVLGVADNLGADLVTYIGDMYNNGAAAQAAQPGRYSCYEQQWFWQNVVAHETGGHNFGLDHAVGHNNPTTIMLHNYCGGSQPYFSNPNIWLNGVKLLGDGSCIGYLAQGGDAAYNLSVSAQGRADDRERRVWGSWLGAPKHRWQFNQSAAAAPAGTTITDSVSGAVATVRGQGATFTGTGLRLPGGTTGNTDANSIAAYLDLPNGLFSSMPNFTIEIWATPLSAKNWMRVIDIGRATEAGDGLGAPGEYTGTPGSPAPGGTSSYDNLMLSAANGNNLNNQRFEAKLAGTAVTADSNLGTIAGELHHYAITFADTATGGIVKWFRDGVLIKTLSVGFHSASLQDVNNWLGRSQWSGDDMAHIEYHDIRIQSAAIADGEVAGNYRIGRHDAVSTMWANDAYGNSGFTNGAWEFGGTPVSTHDYEVGTMMLRTPRNASNVTFPGGSLTITGGNLHINGVGGPRTTTINDLRLKGATVGSFAEGDTTQTLAGNIKLSTWDLNQIRGGWGEMIVSANISTTPGGTGNGILLFTEKRVTLTGTNTGYTGVMRVGDGRFSTLRISNETNLGGNPAAYYGDALELNRGILETTATMTIDDANRGVRIGPGGGIFRPAAGTTLTIASPLTSPAAGNTPQTAPMFPNPVVGYLFKESAGTLVLTNPNNSYIGEMVLSEGVLRLDGAGRLNNGDMHMPLTLNSTLDVNTTGDQIFGGIISGGGTFLKNNTGTTTFYAANTFTGSVTINAGTVFARAENAANNRNFSHVSGITVNNGAILKSQANSLFGWDGTQTKPVNVNSGGVLTTDAANSDVNVGTVTLNGGTLAGFSSPAWGSWNFKRVANSKILVTENSTVSAPNVGLGTTNSIDVSSGKTLTFSGAITDLTGEGVCALVKSNGTGTLTLTGVNTYTGATTLNTGTTLVNGSLGNTAVTVASAATLGGTGSIAGATTINGIHTPGNSAGTQGFGSTLGYGSTSRLKWELTSNSTTVDTFDRAAASGAVTITSGAKIDIILNASGSSVALNHTFWTQSRSWTFLTGSSVTGGFSIGTISTDPGGRSVSNYGTLSLQQNATSATLVFTPYTPTEIWRQANFGESWNDPAIAGDDIDGDKDGLNNLLEYALGSNPNVSSASTAPQSNTDSGKLRITFTRNTAATDLTLSVIAADTLTGPWTEIARSTNGAAFTAIAPGALVSETGTGSVKNVETTDIVLVTDPAHPKRFMRVEVTR